jgi:hypothetical protein
MAQEDPDVNFSSGKVSEYERHTPIVEGTIFFECRSQTGADFNEDWYMALTVAKMGSQVFWDTILR